MTFSVSPLRREASMALSRRRTGVFSLTVLLSLALCAASLWGMNKDILGLFHDDGIYAVVAKSLSEGKGYHIISLPSSPPQTKYPFVYSYILSWVWGLNPAFPENILLLKAVNAGVFFAFLLLSYFFYCKSVEKRGDVLFYIFLVGGNPGVFSALDYPLSETLFLALTLLALLLFGPHGQPSPTPRHVALLSGAVALAYLTRTAGIALILAGILHFLLARQGRKLLLYLFILSGLISPWILWQLSHPTDAMKSSLLLYYVSYDYKSLACFLVWSDPFQAMQVVWGNLRYLIESFDSSLLLDVFPPLRFLMYPLFTCGVYLSLRRNTVFFNSFCLLYLFLMLAWPWHPGRFLLLLIPPALLFLFWGVQAAESVVAARVVSPLIKQLIAALVRLPLVILIAFNLVWLSLYLQDHKGETIRLCYGQRVPYGWDGFVETFAWVREHTDEAAVLATAYDPMYYLYTGRKAVKPWFYKPETYFYPYGKPTANLGAVEEIREALVALGAQYLIIDPLEGYSEQKQAAAKLFDALLHSYPVQPKLVFSSTDGLHRVYSLSDW